MHEYDLRRFTQSSRLVVVVVVVVVVFVENHTPHNSSSSRMSVFFFVDNLDGGRNIFCSCDKRNVHAESYLFFS